MLIFTFKGISFQRKRKKTQVCLISMIEYKFTKLQVGNLIDKYCKWHCVHLIPCPGLLVILVVSYSDTMYTP